MAPSPLDPVALDGSPAQAFASHRARANGIARHFANTRKLADVKDQADENNTVTLIAHFHAVRENPDFQAPGQLKSKDEAPVALRRLQLGHGLVGTHGVSTKRDYDMALKGLMVLAYRYGDLLGTIDNKDGVTFILDTLIPGYMWGGHPPEIEIVEQSFLNIDTPETENHLLMIESSRYLINQLRFARTGDPKYNNRDKGLSAWLIGYIQRLLKHDYLEFNSSPYQRLSLHALLNLHEFAGESDVRDAAQMALDYTFTKYAVSSNRGRRVAPFRRQQHRIAHQGNFRNDLYHESGDQVTGFFLAYTGLVGPEENRPPVPLPWGSTFGGLIAGTALYRPPPAAYSIALATDVRATLHRFYHGNRPRLPASPEDAEPGLEIYYHSPSFLLSAGGQFLNSGYGHDEIDIGEKHAWEQSSRAQATTLIPTRAWTAFHELIRFEPYPDPQIDPIHEDPDDALFYHTSSVNIGVSRGLIAGANMRPGDKKVIREHSTSLSTALASHQDGLYMAWRGTGNENLNVARLQATDLLGIPGVEGIERMVSLGATTDRPPALAWHNGRLYLAWKGSGNNQLNLAFSNDDGRSFKGTITLGDASEQGPALASHNGRLYLGWTGVGNKCLNVAKVLLLGNTSGGFQIGGVEEKVTLGDTSDSPPGLSTHNGRLFLAWRGRGNNKLNLMFSGDNGASFGGKLTLGELSTHGPSLASNGEQLFMAWKGDGNEKLNVAKVIITGNTAGVTGLGGIEAKFILGETSTEAPALGSWRGHVCLSWRGEGANHLNIRTSRDGSFQPPAPWIFADLSPFGFYVAAYRTPPTAQPGGHETPLENLGVVYAAEKADLNLIGIDFNRFRDLTRERNRHLPERFGYGSTYEFHAPDDKDYSIWFQSEGQKYKARVVYHGEPGDNLAALPLVSGPFINSPGGHDGLIEIRHPGSERAPLILDYRSATQPRRIDNRATDPLPWIERAIALFEIARYFNDTGRGKDAQPAMGDAVALYDEFLRLNTDQNGPMLAPAVLKALAGIGVDFSVPEGELLEWLANPEFTPYPATAQALLLLGRKLKAPVFLDVISFNYDQRAPSPRTVADVRTDELKAAIVEGWNVRYGAQVTDFEQILVP